MPEEKGIEINECSKIQEVLEFMEDLPRADIFAIGVWINNRTQFQVSLSGNKEALIYGMRKVTPKVLVKAIDAIVDFDVDDSEVEDDEEDSEDEDTEAKDSEDEDYDGDPEDED